MSFPAPPGPPSSSGSDSPPPPPPARPRGRHPPPPPPVAQGRGEVEDGGGGEGTGWLAPAGCWLIRGQRLQCQSSCGPNRRTRRCHCVCWGCGRPGVGCSSGSSSFEHFGLGGGDLEGESALPPPEHVILLPLNRLPGLARPPLNGNLARLKCSEWRWDMQLLALAHMRCKTSNNRKQSALVRMTVNSLNLGDSALRKCEPNLSFKSATHCPHTVKNLTKSPLAPPHTQSTF